MPGSSYIIEPKIEVSTAVHAEAVRITSTNVFSFPSDWAVSPALPIGSCGCASSEVSPTADVTAHPSIPLTRRQHGAERQVGFRSLQETISGAYIELLVHAVRCAFLLPYLPASVAVWGVS